MFPLVYGLLGWRLNSNNIRGRKGIGNRNGFLRYALQVDFLIRLSNVNHENSRMIGQMHELKVTPSPIRLQKLNRCTLTEHVVVL